MDFYYPRCMDKEVGGFHNQFMDDGTNWDPATKHLVGTCRFVYNFSVASLLFQSQDAPRAEAYRAAATHGLDFLQSAHLRGDGYVWVLSGRDVEDADLHAYGHAFVILAASAATKAGIPGARGMVDEAATTMDRLFWDESTGLFADVRSGGEVDPYRGQNANMHACEATICAYEATRDDRYLARANTLAEKICVDLSAVQDEEAGPRTPNGIIWEHYSTDWSPDWDYNKDDPKHLFRPHGYIPGHFAEWAKLLLILNRYSPDPWKRDRAAELFEITMDSSWEGLRPERAGAPMDPAMAESKRSGMNYLFDRQGRIIDTDRYYWPHNEAAAAAALLALDRPEDADYYWAWYDMIWGYCDRYFIDHEYGGWFRLLDADGNKYSNVKCNPSKTDYHPIASCFEVVEGLEKQGNSRA